MPTATPPQDQYPNGDGIYTPLRKLTRSEIEDQIEGGLDKSRHGR